MSGPDRENSDPRSGTSEEADLSARLRRLRARLDDVEAKRDESEGSGQKALGEVSGAARAFKLSSEFMAGVLVGFGLGWFADYSLGTSPWGLIVLTILGFAAGVLNVVRATAPPARGESPPR